MALHFTRYWSWCRAMLCAWNCLVVKESNGKLYVQLSILHGAKDMRDLKVTLQWPWSMLSSGTCCSFRWPDHLSNLTSLIQNVPFIISLYVEYRHSKPASARTSHVLACSQAPSVELLILMWEQSGKTVGSLCWTAEHYVCEIVSSEQGMWMHAPYAQLI